MKKQLILNIIISFLSMLLFIQLCNSSFFLWISANIAPGFQVKNFLYQKSISKDPQFTLPHYSQMILYDKYQNYQFVIDKYQDIQKSFPKDVMSRYLLGLVNLKHKKLGSAMCDFSQVILFDHNFMWAYYERSQMFAKEGNIERSLMDEITFLELSHNYKGAIKVIKKLLVVFPENGWGKRMLVIVEDKMRALEKQINP